MESALQSEEYGNSWQRKVNLPSHRLLEMGLMSRNVMLELLQGKYVFKLH